MLSAESASGAWPDRAVAMMDRIAQSVEARHVSIAASSPPRGTSRSPPAPMPFRWRRGRFPRPSISRRSSATRVRARRACASRASGRTRRSSHLPPSPPRRRRLAIGWGLHCVLTDDAHDLDDMVANAPPDRLRRRLRRNPARGSSSPPACRSERPAPPTCCASPISARMVPREIDSSPPWSSLNFVAYTQSLSLPGLSRQPISQRAPALVDGWVAGTSPAMTNWEL